MFAFEAISTDVRVFMQKRGIEMRLAAKRSVVVESGDFACG
jgi:hypothetical protein